MNNEEFPSVPITDQQMNIVSIKAIEDIGYDLQDSIVSLFLSLNFFKMAGMQYNTALVLQTLEVSLKKR